MYEGKPVGTPDPGAFWRVCAEHGVRALFTAPTALRAIKQQDPDGAYLRRYDLGRLETLFLAGERCDPPTAIWAADLLKKPVVDHWWQTETGWAITAGFREYGLFPPKPGSGGRPAPGYDLQVLDDVGRAPSARRDRQSLRAPPPAPGCAPTLWQDDDGYVAAYLADFPGWYRTGDAGMIDEDGDVWVMGRTDDIINVAGHRLSTGAMEEVLASHPDVAECAVVGAKDQLKGQAPIGLVVLKAGVERAEPEIVTELVAMVRERIGPVAAFKDARVVARLPKTRSGKILRASIRRIADGEPAAAPATIEDPIGAGRNRAGVGARLVLKETSRYPRDESDGYQADEQRDEIGPDPLHRGFRRHVSDDASRVVAQPKWRREQTEAHRKNDHHRIMHLIHAELARDRKQQRAKQHDGGNALQHAAEHDERHDRNQQKTNATARHRRHDGSQVVREA